MALSKALLEAIELAIATLDSDEVQPFHQWVTVDLETADVIMPYLLSFLASNLVRRESQIFADRPAAHALAAVVLQPPWSEVIAYDNTSRKMSVRDNVSEQDLELLVRLLSRNQPAIE